jgi:hypothetical protein
MGEGRTPVGRLAHEPSSRRPAGRSLAVAPHIPAQRLELAQEGDCIVALLVRCGLDEEPVQRVAPGGRDPRRGRCA